MTYSGFAYLYDLLMNDIPYSAWADYIDNALKRYLGDDPKGRIVVDLACGTGNITLLLAQKGYDMIGVDISTDMLTQAQAKVTDEKILFLAQDMRELDLYGTVDAVICTCDSLNYILDEAELEAVFARVKMFLNPGGVFIFDMNTEYKFKELLGGKSFTAKTEGAAYVWDNHFDADTGINKYHVVFSPEDSKPFEEIHYQRAYLPNMVWNLLQKAGFKSVKTFDGYTNNPPGERCIRTVFLANS